MLIIIIILLLSLFVVVVVAVVVVVVVEVGGAGIMHETRAKLGIKRSRSQRWVVAALKHEGWNTAVEMRVYRDPLLKI